MGRKKLRESDARKILSFHVKRLHGIEINSNFVKIDLHTDFGKLAHDHSWLNTGPIIITPDIVLDSEGFEKLSLQNVRFSEMQEHAEKHFKTTIEFPNHKEAIPEFIVEPYFDSSDKFHFALLSGKQGYSIHFTNLTKTSAKSTKNVSIQKTASLGEKHFSRLFLHVHPNLQEKMEKLLRACFSVFSELKLSLLDIGCLVYYGNGFHTQKLRIEFDDLSAIEYQQKWGKIDFHLSYAFDTSDVKTPKKKNLKTTQILNSAGGRTEKSQVQMSQNSTHYTLSEIQNPCTKTPGLNGNLNFPNQILCHNSKVTEPTNVFSASNFKSDSNQTYSLAQCGVSTESNLLNSALKCHSGDSTDIFPENYDNLLETMVNKKQRYTEFVCESKYTKLLGLYKHVISRQNDDTMENLMKTHSLDDSFLNVDESNASLEYQNLDSIKSYNGILNRDTKNEDEDSNNDSNNDSSDALNKFPKSVSFDELLMASSSAKSKEGIDSSIHGTNNAEIKEKTKPSKRRYERSLSCPKDPLFSTQPSITSRSPTSPRVPQTPPPTSASPTISLRKSFSLPTIPSQKPPRILPNLMSSMPRLAPKVQSNYFSTKPIASSPGVMRSSTPNSSLSHPPFSSPTFLPYTSSPITIPSLPSRQSTIIPPAGHRGAKILSLMGLNNCQNPLSISSLTLNSALSPKPAVLSWTTPEVSRTKPQSKDKSSRRGRKQIQSNKFVSKQSMELVQPVANILKLPSMNSSPSSPSLSSSITSKSFGNSPPVSLNDYARTSPKPIGEAPSETRTQTTIPSPLQVSDPSSVSTAYPCTALQSNSIHKSPEISINAEYDIGSEGELLLRSSETQSNSPLKSMDLDPSKNPLDFKPTLSPAIPTNPTLFHSNIGLNSKVNSTLSVSTSNPNACNNPDLTLNSALCPALISTQPEQSPKPDPRSEIQGATVFRSVAKEPDIDGTLFSVVHSSTGHVRPIDIPTCGSSTDLRDDSFFSSGDNSFPHSSLSVNSSILSSSLSSMAFPSFNSQVELFDNEYMNIHSMFVGETKKDIIDENMDVDVKNGGKLVDTSELNMWEMGLSDFKAQNPSEVCAESSGPSSNTNPGSKLIKDPNSEGKCADQDDLSLNFLKKSNPESVIGGIDELCIDGYEATRYDGDLIHSQFPSSSSSFHDSCLADMEANEEFQLWYPFFNTMDEDVNMIA